MFAILRSKVSVAQLVLGVVLCAFCANGNASAEEKFRIGAKTTEGEIGSAVSLLLPAQASQDDLPQDKEVIAYIKNNKRVDFRKLFPSNWEAICFSGEYQHPVSDIKYELGKDFPACSGSYSKFRDYGLRSHSNLKNPDTFPTPVSQYHMLYRPPPPRALTVPALTRPKVSLARSVPSSIIKKNMRRSSCPSRSTSRTLMS
jgi:hypothetical protein